MTYGCGKGVDKSLIQLKGGTGGQVEATKKVPCLSEKNLYY